MIANERRGAEPRSAPRDDREGRSEPRSEPSRGGDEPEPTSALELAVRAFQRHLVELDRMWQQLTSALARQSSAEVEAAARAVISCWLGARAESQIIENRAADARAHDQRAKAALHDHSRALGGLLLRGLTDSAPGTDLHGTLWRLCTELGFTAPAP